MLFRPPSAAIRAIVVYLHRAVDDVLVLPGAVHDTYSPASI